MTAPQDRSPASRPSMADTLQSTERVLRQSGRGFLVHFYAALRSRKLYPVENEQVQVGVGRELGPAVPAEGEQGNPLR